MFLGIHVDFRYFILSIVSAILFLQNYWCYLTWCGVWTSQTLSLHMLLDSDNASYDLNWRHLIVINLILTLTSLPRYQDFIVTEIDSQGKLVELIGNKISSDNDDKNFQKRKRDGKPKEIIEYERSLELKSLEKETPFLTKVQLITTMMVHVREYHVITFSC